MTSPLMVAVAVSCDAVQRCLTVDGSLVWFVRVGPGLLGFAVANAECAAILDRMLAAGVIRLDRGGPTEDCPIVFAEMILGDDE